MKLYYDFHIHSGLSPCSSNDMSPNNIVNMSLIKELDAIAVTDHNGIANVRVTVEIGEKLGLIVIPGMEIQTVEDIHSLVLFRRIEDLETFYDSIIDQKLKINNKPARFGDQFIYNEDDEVIDSEPYYLITPFNITINQTIELAKSFNGILIPAHINRSSFSILNSLGFISKDLPIENIEWYQKLPEDREAFKKKLLRPYRELLNSDAHELVNISERLNFIDVEEKSIEGIFKTLTTRIKESL